jgi:hypothetical protein
MAYPLSLLWSFVDAVLGAKYIGLPPSQTPRLNPFLNKLTIAKVFFEPKVRHSDHHGYVGAQPYGNPLTGEEFRRRCIPKFNTYDWNALLFGSEQIVIEGTI